MTQLPKTYNPSVAEEKWYQYWLDKGYFHAPADAKRESFSIVIPPPNITGSLHLGHALNNTLQDILIRWKRMQGYNTLWLPGTDHAGIATQNVVEQQLLQEGTNRHQYGREKFIQRVWRWREESGRTIIQQLKKLGSSCDWQRERFTMDEGLSQAVKEVFLELYREGLIYRDDYIINWCPRCQTALSDLEVEHEEIQGHLYYVRYFWVEESGYLTVATTRPETILGDTAVAVNPKDERYRAHLGKELYLPILNRKIPLIADDYVDIEFGTGALKITPAHDPNDFLIGLRHQLAQIKVIGEDGRMTGEAGKYAGMDRFQCRKALLDDLEQFGHLEKVEAYSHSVGHCYRCKTIVEPNLSKQWFVRMKPLADPAIKAVKEGRVRIVPSSWEKTYFEWMYNIRDWCISRQIWWGHRIPAWYCQACEAITVDLNEPQSCAQCGSSNLIQETDVLDTWFSSALWPFSTLGWPKQTRDLEVFYPTSILVTSFDILFFWVARMIMMGLKFMGEVPFKVVYIHALIRDMEGKKMSKSRGNVIDPLIMIERYGADAFRFTLAAFAVQGRDILLSEERIQGYRNFANKIWNAARFTLMNLTDFSASQGNMVLAEQDQMEVEDKWIISRLQRVIDQVNVALEEYKFNEAASSIYHFFWHELCDWYLELIKPRLKADHPSKQTAQQVLLYVLDNSLRLLHPFMPFITEEIWQKLPIAKESIMIASFPEPQLALINPEIEKEMNFLREIIGAIRNIRSELNIPTSSRIDLVLDPKEPTEWQIIDRHRADIIILARVDKLKIGSGDSVVKEAVAGLAGKTEIYVLPPITIDWDEERRRLIRELSKVEEELSLVEAKLSNQAFITKAPAKIKEKNIQKQQELREKVNKLKTSLEKITLKTGRPASL
jgi:valyl-tRNA synthetase